MSRYLQRLVWRTGAEVSPAVPLVPGALRESEERPEFDPFEVVAGPTPELAPPPRQPALAAKGVSPLPASSAISAGAHPELFPAKAAPAVSPPARTESDQMEPPLRSEREQGPEPIAAPRQEIPVAPREVHTTVPMEPPAVERLEPSRPTPFASAEDETRAVRILPARESRAQQVEQRHSDETTAQEPQELEPSKPLVLFSPPTRRPEPSPIVPPSNSFPAENPPEPEPDSPRLVIGRLQVDVLPSTPPLREAVRVVSRTVLGAERPRSSASKLRFGLGQM